MQNTLIHNGYHLERRKQYQSNPRHNLNSSLNFVWKESLDSYPMQLSHSYKLQKQDEREKIKEQYNYLIDKKLQQQLKLDKSSYRVFPQPYNQRYVMDSSLNKGMKEFENIRKSEHSTNSPYKPAGIQYRSQQNAYKLLFGHNISHEPSPKDTYFTRAINERLKPHLSGSSHSASKHQTFAINQPVNINY